MSKIKEENKEKDFKKFEKSLLKMSMEELTELEQQIIKEADENGEELGKHMFALPEENYPEVAKAIRMFINKMSIQWQYALGMVMMYEYWDPENYSKEIPFAHLDSILRTLGEMKYEGYDEWKAVIMINKFFEPLREEYAKVTQVTYDIAARHDAVLRAMDLIMAPSQPHEQ